MENAIGMLGVIALFGIVIVLMDWLGRRKDRQSKQRPTT
jgi:hypothetical protein